MSEESALSPQKVTLLIFLIHFFSLGSSLISNSSLFKFGILPISYIMSLLLS